MLDFADAVFLSQPSSHSMTRSQFILLPSLHSMLLVTYQELVACVVNGYVQYNVGKRDVVVMTQSLLTLTLP